MGRVFIGVGHGGSDAGAVGYLTEKEINLKMALACDAYLKARGVETQISRTGDVTDALSAKIARCNAYVPDLALDIHNNAGGGDGFEVIHSVTGGTGKKLAENIEREVKKIGQNSRGLKTRKNSAGKDYFGFIRSTNCPAVICEGVFVDNKADAAQADTDAECIAFGEAYARGILTTLGIPDTGSDADTEAKNGQTTIVSSATPAKTGQNTVSGYRIKVTATALNIRADAGISSAVTGVIRDQGVYTIVAEKTAGGQIWGKLKSGAGWICLAYTKKI